MGPLAVAAAFLTIVTLGYWVVCLAAPFGRCRWCQILRNEDTCVMCHGTGLRPRIGWQIYHHLTHLYRDTK